MDIRTLKHFIVLSETLHFGRASAKANISTSALSRNIRRLETELNTTLFDRDNRTVSLTPEGRIFQRYARDAVQQWEQIRYDLTDPTEQLSGEIRLYCSVTASHSILVDLLNRFRPAHPGVEIMLQTGDPEHAIEAILALEEELAIAARPEALPPGVLFKPITESPLVFVAPDESAEVPIAHIATGTIADWHDVPMILAAGGIARQRVDAWFEELGVSPQIYAQVAGNEAIVSMVSLGLGVGVVPKIVLDNSPHLARVRVLDVEPALTPYDLGLFTLQRHLKNPLVNAFWSLLDPAD
ncbi:MAG: HTH-type transcriptional activator IlvY [Acidimicrobiia bacterium]|nr:HTH-type transcriptional activator IlvY [Acidimicrobiia bacterium]